MNSAWTDPRLLKALEATLEMPSPPAEETQREVQVFAALCDASRLMERRQEMTLRYLVCLQIALLVGNMEEATIVLGAIYQAGVHTGMATMNTYHESKQLEEMTNV